MKLTSSRAAVDAKVIAAVAIAVILLVGIFLALRKSAPAPSPSRQTVSVKDAAQSTKPALVEKPQVATAHPITTQTSPPPQSTVASPAIPSPPPETAITLHGIVIDAETKAPVPGAKLDLSDGKANNMEVAPPVVASATSDAKGAWSLTIQDLGSGGRFWLVANASGYATTAMTFAVSDGAKEMTIEVVVRKAATLAGRAVDEKGTGIEGVALAVSTVGENSSRTANQPITFPMSWTKSGAGGSFEFANAPSVGAIRLEARKPGFVSAMLENLTPGDRNVVIVLASGGGTIKGDVFDGDGKPAAGVTVNARLPSPDGKRDNSPAVSRITDDAGQFLFEGLHDGTWYVSASPMPSPGDPRGSSAQWAKLEKNATVEVHLKFPRVAEVTGRAVDSASNAGIAGVIVSRHQIYYDDYKTGLLIRKPPSPDECVTDASGAFSIKVTGAFMQFCAEAPAGWEPLSNSEVKVTMENFEDHKPLIIKFNRAAILKGKIVDKNNAPAPGVGIKGYNGRHAVSDNEGLFQMSVPGSGEFKLTARSEDGWDQKTVNLPLANPEERVVMTLQPFAAVSGKVLTSENKPVANAFVTAQYDRNTRTTVTTSGGTEKGDTDEEGYYFKDGLMAGTIYLSVQLPTGSEYAPPGTQTLELKPGERREHIDFIVSGGEIIEGTVTNEEGNPVPGTRIDYNANSQSSIPTFARNTEVKTDEKGYYRITGLSGVGITYNLSVYHEDYAIQSRREVTPLDGAQNFVLKRKSDFVLFVKEEEDEKPVPHYDYVFGGMYALRTNNSVGGHVDDPEGKKTITAPSTDELWISAEETNQAGERSGRAGTAKFTPSGDEQTIVTILIKSTSYRIAGTVVDGPANATVAGADVSLIGIGGNEPSGGVTRKQMKTDASGRFEFSDLMANQYSITAKAKGRSGNQEYKIGLEGMPSMDSAVIVLNASARVHGLVIGRDGKPAAGISMNLRMISTMDSSDTKADASGNYQFEDVTPGPIRVAAYPNDMSDAQTISVKEGEDAEVNFDFSKMVLLTGNLMRNGQPWPEGMETISLKSLNPADRTVYLRSKGGAAFEAAVRPNSSYNVMYLGGSQSRLTVDHIDIAATPAEQQRDINIVLLEADVVIDTGEDAPFIGGSIQIKQVGAGTENDIRGIETATPRKHIPQIGAGTYTASFKSKDGSIAGMSEPVTITAGGENVFYIPGRKVVSQDNTPR